MKEKHQVWGDESTTIHPLMREVLIAYAWAVAAGAVMLAVGGLWI